MTTRQLEAARRLHEYLTRRHWTAGGLVGPDPGIRFNYRIGRFVKSYAPFWPWKDDLYYLQAQGYWVLANWQLFERTGDGRYRELALRCSEIMLERQDHQGAWEYPNPEWRGRIATAEGTWGSLGLLESYARAGDPRFLEGARRWHRFVSEVIELQPVGDTLAVNYFAGRAGARIPNNTACYLRFLAVLNDVTNDPWYREPADALLRFMVQAQKQTGEFPYAVEGAAGEPRQDHFQCFQYNAFQCLDLIEFYRRTGNDVARAVALRVLEFLRAGVAPEGWVFYDCGNRRRTVTYHTAVVAAAFRAGSALGVNGGDELADRCYRHVLSEQRLDGGMIYSRRDYGLLSDRRSYPRYGAMILYHLLTGDPGDAPGSAEAPDTRGLVRQ